MYHFYSKVTHFSLILHSLCHFFDLVKKCQNESRRFMYRHFYLLYQKKID